MKRVKVGIVGLGRLGMDHAKNIAFNIPNAELTAACSISEEEVAYVQKHWSIPYGYTNYDDMLQNKEIDAIAIVSSSPEHCSQIEKALDAGYHVFSEKPLGTTVEECKIAEKAVERNPDKVFMLGFMRRYDPSYEYAKRKITEGAIGKPILVKATSIDPEDTIDGAIRFAESSGGLFIDMTVHDIDLARWFLESDVKNIYSIGGCYLHKEFAAYGDGDNVASLMHFENGAMAMFHSGRNAPHGYHVETEIVGTHGTLRIGSVPQKNEVMIFDSHGARKECVSGFPERFKAAYRLEVEEFIHCILEERKPSISVYDGTKATEVAFAATESFRQNTLVTLKAEEVL
ncbi:Gfo/Idh/MocA family oxidoreductase [Bacillaceae bacterium SIJ1]|uniref:Gfo/Idh/MocA family protein n=1 Tax=Litoribacterium kuwaitense TaxID=1398745 RepID=UPI0013EA0F3C|nr:Gfo/Idh/MocA family oxidoreductase [Litoribacterium kuwaitense]NGP43814.1 Gfo/Idh/MocA family oxidoreductase [Litoribacterium kuwaitense]